MAKLIKEPAAPALAEEKVEISEDRANEARRKLKENRKRTFEMYKESPGDEQCKKHKRLEELVG